MQLDCIQLLLQLITNSCNYRTHVLKNTGLPSHPHWAGDTCILTSSPTYPRKVNYHPLTIKLSQSTIFVNTDLSPHLLILHLELGKCTKGHGSQKMTHSVCQLWYSHRYPQSTLFNFIDRWTEEPQTLITGSRNNAHHDLPTPLLCIHDMKSWQPWKYFFKIRLCVICCPANNKNVRYGAGWSAVTCCITSPIKIQM